MGSKRSDHVAHVDWQPSRVVGMVQDEEPSFIAYWTDISVVLTVLEKSVFTRGNTRHDVTMAR